MMLLTALAFLSAANASSLETVMDRLEHILHDRTARDVMALRGKPPRPVCRKTQTLKDGKYKWQKSWRTDLAEVLFYKTSGEIMDQDFNGEGYTAPNGLPERAGDKLWDYCHACIHMQTNYQLNNDINDYDYREFGEDYCAFTGVDGEWLEEIGELEDGCNYVDDAEKDMWLRDGLIYDPEDRDHNISGTTTCPDMCTDYTSCSSCLENPDDACVWDTETNECSYVNRRNWEYYEAGYNAELEAQFGWPDFVDSASQC